jgi:PHD and RING finger domain-containing protein 1
MNLKSEFVFSVIFLIQVSDGAAVSTAYMSDSSDGQSEKCPICLLSFTTQEIGTPEACDHNFCVDCLVEWAKVWL